MGKSGFVCPNCQTSWDTAQALRSAGAYEWPEIPDIFERLEPGDIVPQFDCPYCGALVEEREQ